MAFSTPICHKKTIEILDVRVEYNFMTWVLMKPLEAREEFEQLVADAGLPVSELKPIDAIRLMLDFYREARADGCDLQADGDTLMFQWGIFEAGKAGRYFDFNLTRQFVDDEAGQDEQTTQLSLTCHFTPTAELEALKTGSKWCASPDELAGFEYFIGRTAAFRVVGKLTPVQVSLTYGAA